jgi:hypothetical protein
LDVNGGLSTDGAPVIQFTPHGAFNQQWAVIPISNIPGRYFIICARSGLAMDVYGGYSVNGAEIVQWTRHGSTNQQWIFNSI